MKWISFFLHFFRIARYNSAILYFNKIYPTPREQETPKDYMLKALVGRANSLIKLGKVTDLLKHSKIILTILFSIQKL